MYACDITWHEQRVRLRLPRQYETVPEISVQRGHAFVIADGVDSIHIDEVLPPPFRVPLTGDLNRWAVEFARIAPRLLKRRGLRVDGGKAVGILEPGIDKVEDQLGSREPLRGERTPR